MQRCALTSHTHRIHHRLKRCAPSLDTRIHHGYAPVPGRHVFALTIAQGLQAFLRGFSRNGLVAEQPCLDTVLELCENGSYRLSSTFVEAASSRQRLLMDLHNIIKVQLVREWLRPVDSLRACLAAVASLPLSRAACSCAKVASGVLPSLLTSGGHLGSSSSPSWLVSSREYTSAASFGRICH